MNVKRVCFLLVMIFIGFILHALPSLDYILSYYSVNGQEITSYYEPRIMVSQSLSTLGEGVTIMISNRNYPGVYDNYVFTRSFGEDTYTVQIQTGVNSTNMAGGVGNASSFVFSIGERYAINTTINGMKAEIIISYIWQRQNQGR